MSGITLILSGKKGNELTKRCVEAATTLTHCILHRNTNDTMVIVRYVDNDDWLIDGKSLQEWGKNSFRLEVNSPDKTYGKYKKLSV